MKFLKVFIAGIGALTLAFGAQAQTTFNGPGNIPFESYVARLPAPVTINSDDTLYLLQNGGSYGVQVGAVFNNFLDNLLTTANTWTVLQTFNGGIDINVSGLTLGFDIQQQPGGTATSSLACDSNAPYTAFYGLNCITEKNWNVASGTALAASLLMVTEINGVNARADNGAFGISSFIDFYKDAGAIDNGYASIQGVGRVLMSPTATNFYMEGMNWNVSDSASLTWSTGSQLVGAEGDITTNSAGLTGRALLKFVVADPTSTNVQGSTFDSIIYVQTNNGSAFGFKNFALIDFQFGTPIGSNGCILCTNGSATIATGVDFSSLTVTGYFLKGPGDLFRVDNTGDLVTNGFGQFAGVMQIFTATAIPAGGAVGEGFTFFSTANFGTFGGSGAPTLTAARGSIYLRNDGGDYINTNGSTGWDQIASLAATQTLTNKTIAFSSNTLTGVAPLASPTFSGTITGPDSGTWGSGGINGSIIGGTTPEAITGTAVTVTGALVNSGIGLIGSLTKKGTVCVSTTNEIYYSATTC